MSWRTKITALFKNGGLKDQMIAGEPQLEDNNSTILCATILTKISPSTHSNIVTSINKEEHEVTEAYLRDKKIRVKNEMVHDADLLLAAVGADDDDDDDDDMASVASDDSRPKARPKASGGGPDDSSEEDGKHTIFAT